jgi:HEPN domain-containing protein
MTAILHLDLHHPPCGVFNANRAFYSAGQIAQILLVALQMKLLPKEAQIHSIRTIIRDIVRVAGKLVCHARKWKLLFAKSALRLHWISHAADCLISSV